MKTSYSSNTPRPDNRVVAIDGIQKNEGSHNNDTTSSSPLFVLATSSSIPSATTTPRVPTIGRHRSSSINSNSSGIKTVFFTPPDGGKHDDGAATTVTKTKVSSTSTTAASTMILRTNMTSLRKDGMFVSPMEKRAALMVKSSPYHHRPPPRPSSASSSVPWTTHMALPEDGKKSPQSIGDDKAETIAVDQPESLRDVQDNNDDDKVHKGKTKSGLVSLEKLAANVQDEEEATNSSSVASDATTVPIKNFVVRTQRGSFQVSVTPASSSTTSDLTTITTTTKNDNKASLPFTGTPETRWAIGRCVAQVDVSKVDNGVVGSKHNRVPKLQFWICDSFKHGTNVDRLTMDPAAMMKHIRFVQGQSFTLHFQDPHRNAALLWNPDETGKFSTTMVSSGSKHVCPSVAVTMCNRDEVREALSAEVFWFERALQRQLRQQQQQPPKRLGLRFWRFIHLRHLVQSKLRARRAARQDKIIKKEVNMKIQRANSDGNKTAVGQMDHDATSYNEEDDYDYEPDQYSDVWSISSVTI